MGANRIRMEHFLGDTRYTPISVITLCNCGWQHEESRRQNARGRAAKTKAAMKRHFYLAGLKDAVGEPGLSKEEIAAHHAAFTTCNAAQP